MLCSVIYISKSILKSEVMMKRAFLQFYKPYKHILVLLVCGSFFTSAMDLLFPYLVKHILDVEIPQGNLSGMLRYVIILFSLYIFNTFLLYNINYHGHVMSAKMENDMRRKLFQHMQNMSFKYFDNVKTGQLLSRLTSDITEIGELAFRGPNDIIVCLISMGGTIVILFWINIYLGFLIAALLIAKTIHTIFINRKMKAAFRRNRAKNGELSAQASESLGGIRLVKAFAGEKHELDCFMNKSNEYLNTRKQSYKLLAYFSGSINFFTNITNLSILAVGGILILNQKLSFSDFVAFLLYVNLFMKPLLRLTVFTEMYQRGMAGFQRFYEITQLQPDILDKPDAITCSQLKGEIVFNNLSFSYNQETPVLQNINLTIKPGEKIAFVGETGAGKTTIANLLLRFYEPTEGEIIIDGVNIQDYIQQDLRRSIGLVQQDVFLFSDSIKHNIAYAYPNATDEQIKHAATAAAANAFIDNLPFGYDTEIGERGVKLSGGQKQRVAIARVFLKNPPILILDEATSALDNKTEQQIQNALDLLSHNRTTLIIAHRLTTIRNADKIIVLANGQIKEIGTHEELLNKNGIYANLYTSNNSTIK